MFKSMISISLVWLLMTGCISGLTMKSETTLNDVSATTSLAMAQEECYKSDKIEQGSMNAAEFGMAIAIQSLRDVALSAQGRPKCSIVSVYDSQIAEVEAKAVMTTNVIGSAASVLTNGIIGASVVGLVGNSGNEYETSGFGADIVVADKSNNDPNFDSFNPTTLTTTTTNPSPSE